MARKKEGGLRNFFLSCALIVTIVTVAAGKLAAASLPDPSDTVILSISGKIVASNRGDAADFDRAMLQSVGMRVVESLTPWTDGLQRFEGVSLQALLDLVGADGDRLVAVALNDYRVEIPIGDASEHDVLLAMKHNGKWMSVRDKGPIWIIYPHQGNPKDIPDLHATRMVWQLRSLRAE